MEVFDAADPTFLSTDVDTFTENWINIHPSEIRNTQVRLSSDNANLALKHANLPPRRYYIIRPATWTFKGISQISPRGGYCTTEDSLSLQQPNTWDGQVNQRVSSKVPLLGYHITKYV